MDVPTALIGVGVFVVSGFVLFIIYRFGIKEKSYEEAVAEQREQVIALLGAPSRPKSKDKKIKKANKKAKEKQASSVTERDDVEEVDGAVGSSSHTKHHVEFKEATVIEDDVPPPPPPKPVKRVRRARPILVRKSDDGGALGAAPPIFNVPTANHFEQLHPKDDLELLHTNTHVKEEKKKQPPKAKVEQQEKETTKVPVVEPKEKGAKGKGDKVKEKQEVKKQASVKPMQQQQQQQPAVAQAQEEKKQLPEEKKQPEEKKVVQAAIVPQLNGYVSNPPPPPVKEKKKKKAEVNILQQLAATRDADITLQLLQNVVRKAELTRSEVQLLIDLLLNKQHEAPEVIDDWTEGKADPVQKLKKQLAEKERLLQAEQEACAGAQHKLKELRNELNAEKVHMHQRQRGFDETIQSAQFELQAANGLIQTQIQSLQQVQAQLNDERATFQMQRQQFEVRAQQMQETETALVQLRNEIGELQGRNQQLQMEVHALTEQNINKEHQQALIAQLQHQLNHYKNEADQKEEIYKELEDVRRNLDHQINVSHRQENEWKMENAQLKATYQKQVEEVRRLELADNQAKEKIRLLTKQKEDTDHLVNQLKVELQDSQAEKSELQALKANGVTEANNTHKEELLNLHNELTSLQHQLQHVQSEHGAQVERATRLENDLEEQRNKNNELRKKNWKVMEALNAAESRIKYNNSHSAEDLLVQVRIEQQQLNKNFLERLLPDVRLPHNDLAYDTWLTHFEQALKGEWAALKASNQTGATTEEMTRLQGEVDHYKSAFDESEAILKKLEEHILQEEIKWRRELKVKEAEIEALKEANGTESGVSGAETPHPGSLGVQFAYKCIEKSLPMIVDELEIKVAQLERQLKGEQRDRAMLKNEIEIYKNLHN